MKRYPRPVNRYPRNLIPRPVERYPRDYGPRLPRPIRRFPRGEQIVRRPEGFPPLYDLERKPKDEYPELFAELQALKEKFQKLGRKISLHCIHSRDRHMISLETCLCRCKRKCELINFRNLVGPDEGPAQYIDDFVKYQRLVNQIYGTVRTKDVKIADDKGKEKE